MMRIHKLLLGSFVVCLFLLLGVVPVRAAYLPRLVDDADLLTASEKDELIDRLDRVSKKRKCDVVIVTSRSLGGESAQDYADDYFYNNGYGMGDDKDGILLLVSMEDRDWYMSTSGFGIDAFTDAGMEYMSRQFLPDLTSGDYYKAFETFTDLSDDYLAQARKGKPYDEGNLPKKPFNPFLLLGDFGAAFLASFFMAGNQKSKLKSVRRKTRAGVYMVKGSLDLEDAADIFVTSRTSSRVIHRDDDDFRDHGPGGSSTHIGSSGHVHGGMGGKF